MLRCNFCPNCGTSKTTKLGIYFNVKILGHWVLGSKKYKYPNNNGLNNS